MEGIGLDRCCNGLSNNVMLDRSGRRVQAHLKLGGLVLNRHFVG